MLQSSESTASSSTTYRINLWSILVGKICNLTVHQRIHGINGFNQIEILGGPRVEIHRSIGCCSIDRKIIADKFDLFVVIPELLKLVELMISKLAGNEEEATLQDT